MNYNLSLVNLFKRKSKDRPEIIEVRNTILMRIIVFGFLPVVFAVIPGIYQTWSQGRWGYLTIYAVGYLLFLTSFVFMLRKNFVISGSLLVMGLFCISIVVLSWLGLSGIGLELMIAACFACSVLFSIRRSLIMIGMGMIVIGLISYGMVFDLLVIDESQMFTSKSWLAWLTAATVFCLGTLLMVITPQMILMRLEESLEIAHQKADNLKQSNELLFKEMSKRIKVEEEKRQLRKYLVNIIDFMPSILIGLDEEICISHWNKEAEKATGQPSSFVKGKSLVSFFPQLKPDIEGIRNAIFQNKTYQHSKLTIELKNGMRVMDLLVYPIKTGDTNGAVVRMDDNTSRIQMEETMIQTDKLASIGCLTAGIAHEINNPLGIILQGVQMISNRLSPEQKKNREVADRIGIDLEKMSAYMKERKISKYIAGIKDAGHRSAEIISNMLKFSRKSESRKSMVAITELIEKALVFVSNDFSLAKNYDFKRIVINKEYDPSLNLIVCNETEIEQVLLNIIKNAAQALQAKNDDEPPSITIRAINEDTTALLEIKDNGPGMDSVIAKRIFEPFYTTKDVGQGTGLGLAVSYMIVTNNHGGTMEVESSPGKGTVFSIRLPK